MRETTHRSFVSSSSLLLLLSVAACVDPGDGDAGTVRVDLVGQAPSGMTYRLRDVAITVTGADGTHVLRTEDDPELASVAIDVAAGDYTATVAAGWRVERLVPGGAPVPVEATLARDPIAFTIAPADDLALPLDLRVDGEPVVVGAGAPGTAWIASGILTTASSVAVVEGGRASVGVRLTSAPTAPLTVTVSSSDPGAVAVSPTTLTFTPTSWATVQTVAISGVQDADTVNEAVVLSLTSPGATGTTVTVRVADDDVQAIVTTASSLAITEGGSGTVGVRLAFAPVSTTTVTVSSNDSGAAAASPTTLTFTPANWSTAQPVVVTGVQDADTANEAVTLAFASAAAPTRTVPVAVADDDVQAIVTTASSLAITEGGSGTVGVRLAVAPVAPTTVTVSSSDVGAVAASPTTLTFTPANWSTPQPVVVTGVQDADTANESVTLAFASAGVPTRTIVVAVTDDDVQAIVPTVASLAIAEGGSGTVGVRLAFAPVGTVTVTISSSDTGAAAVSPTTLTFTAANWSTAQALVVSGVQDLDTANEAVTLVLASPGVASRTVAVAVTDDDL